MLCSIDFLFSHFLFRTSFFKQFKNICVFLFCIKGVSYIITHTGLQTAALKKKKKVQAFVKADEWAGETRKGMTISTRLSLISPHLPWISIKNTI